LSDTNATPLKTLPVRAVLLTNIISPHQEVFYAELARRLGHLTILVSAPHDPDNWRDWKAQWGSLNVRLQRTSTVRWTWRHPVGFEDPAFLHIPWDTLPQLRALKPDVIIASELGSRTAFSAIYKALHRETPLVLWAALSEHTESGRGWLRRRLRKWLVRRADCLIVNGHSGERYMRRLGYKSPNCHHVPYAALPGVFDHSPSRDAASAHRLVYVGRLSQRKGILPFTKVLARWAAAHPERQVDFSLVGSGPLQAELEGLPKSGNCTLRFLGNRDYAGIATAYAEAGIFAFPTLADEWGLVVNEAMAAGLPVLGSRYAQAVEELCVEDVTGWSYRPDRDEEIHRALDRVFATTPEQLNAMRTAAREKIAPLNAGNMADRVIDALRITLENAAHGRGASLLGRQLHCRPESGDARGDSATVAPAPRSALVAPTQRRPDARRAVPTALPLGPLKSLAILSTGRLGVCLNRVFGSRSKHALGILTYHRVTPAPAGIAAPPDNTTPEQLREHLLGLRRCGYAFLPLREVLARARRESLQLARGESVGAAVALPPPTAAERGGSTTATPTNGFQLAFNGRSETASYEQAICVTFDDGLEGVYRYALPILRELNVPATVFVCSGYLDREGAMPFDDWGIAHRDCIEPAMYRSMTTAQAREMQESGLVELGCHTHTHADCRGRPELLRQELQTSQETLSAKFGPQAWSFAFPYGGSHLGFADAELVDVVRRSGATCALTTDPTTVDWRGDPFCWGRFNVFPWDDSATLAAKLAGWYGWAPRLWRPLARLFWRVPKTKVAGSLAAECRT